MLEKTTFIVCGDNFRNQTIASIRFGKWGNPLNVDLRFVDEWSEVQRLKYLKEYIFLLKSGTVFADIELFFHELSPILLRSGLGHIVYDKKTKCVKLNDQALLIRSSMIPKTFGSTTSLYFPNFIKSGKNIHHDYTPTFVRKANGHKKIKQSQFGQDVISSHLNKYLYFNNFPKEVRQHKVLITNPDVSDPFLEYKNMIENTLWVFNNEYLDIKNQKKVLCTAGGIGWFLQTADEIHICDISKIQLKFVDQIINKWDGKNFGQFVHKFILENKVIHFHINLGEEQDSNRELFKDRPRFINAVNKNFKALLQKYRPGISIEYLKRNLQNKKITSEGRNILERVQNYQLAEINLSNIFDFKYNYVTDHIDSWKNLISPATKAFIKSCENPKKNPYPDIPCEAVDLAVPVDDVREEIMSIHKYLVRHRQESGTGWSSFCIHGKSYDSTKEDSFYNDKRPHKWTKEALENMPRTIEWLKSLGYKSFDRVRVMCLEPKSFINIHRDRTDSRLGPINVAITHPKDCKFYLEHYGELKFTPGKAYRLNLVNYHAVINESNEPRYHIIIHGGK